MTTVLPGLSVRDSQILELLRGGAPIQRVIDIGRHRKSWNPVHVGSVVAFHLDDRPTLRVVPEPKPVKARKVAPCGTTSGYTRHTRRGEKACDECAQAKREYSRANAAMHRAEETGVVLTEWAPEKFTGKPTKVTLTPKQAELLGQLCRGLSNGQIAIAGGLSIETIRTRVTRVLAALGARDRNAAVIRVLSGQVRVYISDSGVTRKGERTDDNENEGYPKPALISENGCGQGGESLAAAPPSSVDHRRAVPK